MNTTPPTAQGRVVPSPIPVEVRPEWAPDLYGLLTQAAEIAVRAGIPPEAFTAAAWHAYLHASPALAQHLEEMQFNAAVEELRTSGRLAKA